MKKIICSIAFLVIFLGLNMVKAQEAPLSKIPPDLGGVTIKPANPNSIRPPVIIIEMAPGTEYTDAVIIKNTTDNTVTINNYPADGTTTTTGDFTMKTNKEKQENIGAWTTLEETKVELDPHEEKTISFTITVPENAELKEYKGGITSTRRGEEINGVITSTRIVVPVELKVTNDPQPVPKLVTTQANVFAPTPFFWGTVVIFLGCMGYFVYANQKEKKQKKVSNKSK
jgi:uncharacterized membrane protein